MEKKLSKSTLVLVTMTGNSYGDKQKKSNGTQEEGLISVKKPFDEKVSYKLAMGCVELYKNTPLGRIKKKTESVSFDKELLKNWTDSLESVTEYDKLEVKFGIYTSDILVGRSDAGERKDRLTVFLFPTLEGNPAMKNIKGQDDPYVEPFNMGEVHP